MSTCCETCLYFTRLGLARRTIGLTQIADGEGQCQRYPPSIPLIVQAGAITVSGYETLWPKVLATDLCGEYVEATAERLYGLRINRAAMRASEQARAGRGSTKTVEFAKPGSDNL